MIMSKKSKEPKDLNKEQLVEVYDNLNHQLGDIEAAISVVKEELFNRIEGNGEVIGHYALTKSKRVNFKVDLEQAKKLGALKMAVDTAELKKRLDKGEKIPHDVTTYLLIRALNK